MQTAPLSFSDADAQKAGQAASARTKKQPEDGPAPFAAFLAPAASDGSAPPRPSADGTVTAENSAVAHAGSDRTARTSRPAGGRSGARTGQTAGASTNTSRPEAGDNARPGRINLRTETPEAGNRTQSAARGTKPDAAAPTAGTPGRTARASAPSGGAQQQTTPIGTPETVARGDARTNAARTNAGAPTESAPKTPANPALTEAPEARKASASGEPSARVRGGDQALAPRNDTPRSRETGDIPRTGHVSPQPERTAPAPGGAPRTTASEEAASREPARTEPGGRRVRSAASDREAPRQAGRSPAPDQQAGAPEARRTPAGNTDAPAGDTPTARTDRPQGEPVADARVRTSAPRTDSARPDLMRIESMRIESVRIESAHAETARPETVRPETARPESAQRDSVQKESTPRVVREPRAEHARHADRPVRSDPATQQAGTNGAGASEPGAPRLSGGQDPVLRAEIHRLGGPPGDRPGALPAPGPSPDGRKSTTQSRDESGRVGSDEPAWYGRTVKGAPGQGESGQGDAPSPARTMADGHQEAAFRQAMQGDDTPRDERERQKPSTRVPDGAPLSVANGSHAPRVAFAESLPGARRPDGWFQTLVDQAGQVPASGEMQTLEMQLDEGDGTLIIRVLHSDDHVSVSVGLSEAGMRATVQAQADRIQQALQAQYQKPVDFSLFQGHSGSAQHQGFSAPRHQSGRHAPSTGADVPVPHHPTPRTLPGASHEWVG